MSSRKSEQKKDKLALHKKWSFPLRISSVNVTKSPVSCRVGRNYWRNPSWKISFFMQCSFQWKIEYRHILLLWKAWQMIMIIMMTNDILDKKLKFSIKELNESARNFKFVCIHRLNVSQPAITCSKLTIETVE